MRVAIDHAIEGDAAWYCWHASRRQAMLEKVWDELDVLHHQQIKRDDAGQGSPGVDP